MVSIELVEDRTELELDLSSESFLVLVPSFTEVLDVTDPNCERFVASPGDGEVGDFDVRVPVRREAEERVFGLELILHIVQISNQLTKLSIRVM